MRALVVLDERWYSALTDLGVKIARSISGECSVAVAAIPGYPAWKVAGELGFKRFGIEDPRRGLPFKPFLSLKKTVEEFKPQVLFTIRGDEMLFGALLKKRFGFKLFRLHGHSKGVRESFLNRELHRRFVDGVVVSSRKLVNSVISELPKIFVPGIVDTEVFSFSREGRELFRKELKVGNRKLIGVVGRLDPVKGHRLFLRALSLLKREDYVAAVVGEEKNEKLEDLKKLSAELGISDRVVFIPERLPSISHFMSACDLAVVPSVGSEVIARAPLEFMACRTPVVSTNVGVLPEVIRPPYGLSVSADERSLSAAINSFLSKDLKKLGKIAEEVADEKFSFKALSPVIRSFICGGV